MGTVTKTTADINNVLNLANGYIAAPWNSATSYAVGDYCSRSGKVYRCTAATSGSWVASRWVEVVIGDELAKRINYNSIVLGEAKQVSSGSDNFTQLQTIDLPAGVWLITAGASFGNNANGYRQIGLTNADSISVDRLSPTAAAVNGSGTGMSLMRVFYLASAGTIYLWGRHNAGAALSVYPYMQAVQLK